MADGEEVQLRSDNAKRASAFESGLFLDFCWRGADLADPMQRAGALLAVVVASAPPRQLQMLLGAVAAGLKLADVDFDLDVLRALPFGRKSARALDRYLRARARHPQAHLD